MDWSGANSLASFQLTSPYLSATVNTIKPRRHLSVARVQLLGPVWLGLILLRGSVSRQSQLCSYWHSLLKQSDVKCLAYTHKLTRTAAGTLSLMKHNHCLFCCSVAGTEYRHLCWFIQQQLSNCVSSSEQRRCETLLSLRWTHRNSPRGMNAPLSDISYHRTVEVGLW